MSNRVLLNQSGLKISAPGVDVLSANNAQLQFSSDWQGMGVVQSGTYNVTWTKGPGSANNGKHSGDISLVKAFSSPPFCVFYLVQGSTQAPLFYGFGGALAVNRGDASLASSSCLSVQVGTTSIAIRAMYFKASNGVTTPFYNMRYFVFDNNL